MALFLGLDIGSSSIKAALLDGETGFLVASAQFPDDELRIESPAPGWAEQDPEVWWECVVEAVRRIKDRAEQSLDGVAAIGVSYQMHGLVLTDENGTPVRPSIIWCDSRAVTEGKNAAATLGEAWCHEHLLNLPGNFTLSKLLWVAKHEPDVLARARHLLLPGDYIAMKLSGEATTTPSGLSEGTLWDLIAHEPALGALEQLGLPTAILPEVRPNIGRQVELSAEAAKVLGLRDGIPISYRAGDQPNNALSLGVMEPGEVATTAGTSGVIYGVTGRDGRDASGAVNPFLHVNHTSGKTRLGVLLCINGTGALYRWLKNTLNSSYDEMNYLAAAAAPGSDGLTLFPYGNGAERTLGNRLVGAQCRNIDFNRHGVRELCRAALEGICFALRVGTTPFSQFGLTASTFRAGNANLFLSPAFREIFTSVLKAPVSLYGTDGAQGAARGAALGVGASEPFRGLTAVETRDPDPELVKLYDDLFGAWRDSLERELVQLTTFR